MRERLARSLADGFALLGQGGIVGRMTLGKPYTADVEAPSELQPGRLSATADDHLGAASPDVEHREIAGLLQPQPTQCPPEGEAGLFLAAQNSSLDSQRRANAVAERLAPSGVAHG